VDPAASTRRIFLKRSLKWGGLGLGGLALLAGGGGWALFRDRPAASGRAVLGDDDVRFFEAAAEAYFPPGNALGLDVRDLDVAATLDAQLAVYPATHQRIVRSLMAIFDNWPRMSFSSASRFTDLPLDGRIRVLERFDASEVHARRGLGEILRILVGIAVFEHPQAATAVGLQWGCGPMT
jgi:hypothetical protein